MQAGITSSSTRSRAPSTSARRAPFLPRGDMSPPPPSTRCMRPRPRACAFYALDFPMRLIRAVSPAVLTYPAGLRLAGRSLPRVYRPSG
jgi:hypothetical protein